MAAVSELWGALGTEVVVATNTNLSNLANNALFLSGDFDNTQVGSKGQVWGRVRATLTMAVGATAGTGFSIWFLKSQDGGTTFERGGTGYTPLRAPALVVPAPTDTTQTESMWDVLLPAGHFKILIKNDGTGQATKTDTTSAGSQLSITPFTDQGV